MERKTELEHDYSQALAVKFHSIELLEQYSLRLVLSPQTLEHSLALKRRTSLDDAHV